MSGYRRVLSSLGVSIGGAALARLPLAMAPLSLVLMVQALLGNYAAAGLVSGAYALAQACVGPLWGRAYDRFGPTRVILPASIVGPALLTGLGVVALQRPPLPLLLVLAALAGAATAQISPSARALYRFHLDAADRHSGWSLDAAIVELLFVLGPLVVGALVTAPVLVPVLATAAVQAIGGALYSLSGAVRAMPGARRTSPARLADDVAGEERAPARRRLLTPAVIVLVSVSVLISAAFGQFDLAMTGTAAHVLGNRGEVGLLFTFIAGGSAVGGLLYGSRTWSHDPVRWLARVTAVLAGGQLVAGLLVHLAPGTVRHVPALLFALLFVTGLAIAPGLIMQGGLMDRLAPPDRLSEAQAWLSTAFTSGSALGTSLAGPLVDRYGAGAGMLGAAAATGLAVLLALACGPLLRRARAQDAGTQDAGAQGLEEPDDEEPDAGGPGTEEPDPVGARQSVGMRQSVGTRQSVAAAGAGTTAGAPSSRA